VSVAQVGSLVSKDFITLEVDFHSRIHTRLVVEYYLLG